MKQESKQLVLKDLCARLPYKVKVTTTNAAVKFGVISGISIENKISVRTKQADIVFDCTEVKPYLFPLSSMTEEQKREYEDTLVYHDYTKGGWTIAKTFNDEYVIPYWFVDFCNKNHLDYRGLIPKGLAIDCTNLSIY